MNYNKIEILANSIWCNILYSCVILQNTVIYWYSYNAIFNSFFEIISRLTCYDSLIIDFYLPYQPLLDLPAVFPWASLYLEISASVQVPRQLTPPKDEKIYIKIRGLASKFKDTRLKRYCEILKMYNYEHISNYMKERNDVLWRESLQVVFWTKEWLQGAEKKHITVDLHL